MGYSAPVTDLTVTSLIATQFKGSVITPVNKEEKMVERAAQLGDRRNPPHVVEEYVGDLALRRWTDTFAS